MTWCLTYSGKKFDIVDPKPEQICIKDIAHALSKQCRFNGHCREFYSVAQHSALVARFVSPEYRLAALLHDATEAYVGDLVSPLKAMLPDFKVIENNIWQIIADKFGVPRELPPEVKHVDLMMLATEKRDLMPALPESWPMLDGIEPVPSLIMPQSPAQAEQYFLHQFHLLTDGVWDDV